MPYQVSMMGWVGSGEDLCGLGWVQKFWVGLSLVGFWKSDPWSTLPGSRTRELLITNPLSLYFVVQFVFIFIALIVMRSYGHSSVVVPYLPRLRQINWYYASRTSGRFTYEKTRTGRSSRWVECVERFNSCCWRRRRSIFPADARCLRSAAAIRPAQTSSTTRGQSRRCRHIVSVSHGRHGFCRPETGWRRQRRTERMVDGTWRQRLLVSAVTDVDELERRTCRAAAPKHGGTADVGADSTVADQERGRQRFPLDDKASCVKDGWRSSGRRNRCVPVVAVGANSHRGLGLRRRSERRYVKTPHAVVSHRGRRWRRWRHVENSSRIRHECWVALQCSRQQSLRQSSFSLVTCCTKMPICQISQIPLLTI